MNDVKQQRKIVYNSLCPGKNSHTFCKTEEFKSLQLSCAVLRQLHCVLLWSMAVKPNTSK